MGWNEIMIHFEIYDSGPLIKVNISLLFREITLFFWNQFIQISECKKNLRVYMFVLYLNNWKGFH